MAPEAFDAEATTAASHALPRLAPLTWFRTKAALLLVLLIFPVCFARDLVHVDTRRGTLRFTDTVAGAPPSPLPYTTGKKVIRIGAALAVPIIEQAALENTFPRTEVSYVTIDEMRLDSFSIKALKIEMATPAPPNITVHIVNLRLSIPDTKFVFKYGILSCPGTVRLWLNDTHLTFNMLAHVTNETLRIAVSPETTSIAWGPLSIEHDLDSLMCRIGQSIVQVFIGQMDQLIEKNLKEQLPIMLPANIEKEANDAMEKSDVAFTAPLVLTPERAVGQVDMLPRSERLRIHSTAADGRAARVAAGTDELPLMDGAAIIYGESVNNYLRHAHGKGLLNSSFLLPPEFTSQDVKEVFPAAYELCPNCSLGFGLATGSPPLFATSVSRRCRNWVQLKVTNLNVGFYLFPKTEAQFIAATRMMRALRGPTPTPEAFASFKMRPLTSHGLNVRGKSVPALSADWIVPVGAFSVDATLAVEGLGVVGDRLNSIQYTIAPVRDFSVRLIASNMGPINMTSFAQDVLYLANKVVIPLANLDSPFPLPSPIKDVFLNITKESITCGFNIGLF